MDWLDRTNINNTGSGESASVFKKTGLTPMDQHIGGTVNFEGGLQMF